MSALNASNDPEPWLEVVRRKVATIRYGSVLVTVHDGHVTQVEAVEKTRFVPDKPGEARPGSR